MSVNEKLGIKKSNLIGLIIVAAAVIFGLVNHIMILATGHIIFNIISIAELVIYLLILYFAIWGYRVPNGKMLKYVFLLLALKQGLEVGTSAYNQSNVAFICGVFTVILLAFIGGRLPRVNENKINIGILLAISIFMIVFQMVASGRGFVIGRLNPFIQMVALAAAYFARAQQYKENSGILDDK